jgi:hypothetical protein
MGYDDDAGGLDGKHNSPIYLNEIVAAVYGNLPMHSLLRGCRSGRHLNSSFDLRGTTACSHFGIASGDSRNFRIQCSSLL